MTTDETKKKAPEPAAPAQPANRTQLAASAKVDAPSKLPGLRQPAKEAVQAPEPAAPAQPANITQLAASAKVDAPSKLPGLRQPAKEAVQAPEPLSEESIIRNLERARDEYAPESDAMKKRRERRRKWEKIINSIGDSVGSLSNLYFTTKRAPDMLKGTSTLSGKAKERYDKAKALRDANRANYLRYSMEIGREKGKQARWQAEQARWQAEQAAKQADRDYKRELGKAKNARDEMIAKLQGDLLGKKIQVAEYEAGIKKIEKDYAEEQQKADIIRKKRVGTGRGGGSGGNGRAPGEYPWYDKNGGIHYAHSYEAARQNALQHGTWQEGTQTSERVEHGMLGDEKTTTTKTGKGHSVKPGTIAYSNTANIKW